MAITKFDDLDNMLLFSEEITEYLHIVEDPLSKMEFIAKEFVDDLMKLSRPRSSISKKGYTHMVDSFAWENTGKDIAVGWGKYYGKFVEQGTRKMGAQPHLEPTFNKNVDKYINDFKKEYNLDD